MNFAIAQKKNVSGYDDNYFHTRVTPEMKCNSCGKSTLSEGGDIQKVQTKYPDHHQI